MKRNSVKFSSIICGLLFLAAGALLFAFNAGVLTPEYKNVVFSWQTLLVAIGFVSLFSRHKWGLGIILMMIGGFFLLPKLDIVGLDFIARNRWAIALVVIGFFVLCSSIWRRNNFLKFGVWTNKELSELQLRQNWDKHKSESGFIDSNCVFSSAKEKWELKNFKGGEINNVFGGVEIDFSDAQLAEGTNHLEINSIFGGVVLYVPIDWNIEIRKTQAFGAFEDNRPKPGFEVDEKRTLIIEANVVFGGGEIKCKQL